MVDIYIDVGWRTDPSIAAAIAKHWHAQTVGFEERSEKIVAAGAFPSVRDLVAGHPPYAGSLVADVAHWVARSRAVEGLPDDLRETLRDFGVFAGRDGAARIFHGARALKKSPTIPSQEQLAAVYHRAAWYGALFGDRDLRGWLVSRWGDLSPRCIAYRLGLEAGTVSLNHAGEWSTGMQQEIVDYGRQILRTTIESFECDEKMREHRGSIETFRAGRMQPERLFAVLNPNAPAPVEKPEENVVQDFIDDAVRRFDEGDMGFDESGNIVDDDMRRYAADASVLAQMSKHPKLRIIQKLPEGGNSDQKAFVKGFTPLADGGTKLIVARDVADIATDLAIAWPHAVDVVYRVLADVVEGKPVRMRPVLLVGSPGSGKTTLLNAISSRLGLSSVVYPCASVSDSSFGGTPAQRHSRRVSTPLQLIRTSGTANPAVILDELEKTGVSSQNGSLIHSLLPMLERHSASSYFETALEVPVDLSGVVFLATANDLGALSDPIRDRFRVIRMPDATLEHLQPLAASMAIAVAEERGLPLSLVEEMAPDELDVIGRVWGGGSLRKLRSAVEATLDLRDRVAVRQ